MKSLERMTLAIVLTGASLAFGKAPHRNPTSQSAEDISSYGSVTGRVFAITKGGDLKPGRLARVYLLFAVEAVNGKVGGSDEKTAGNIFLEALNQGAETNLKKMQEYAKNPILSSTEIEAMSCTDDLQAADAAIMRTLAWSVGQNHQSEVLSTDADEEGDFTFAKVQRGSYVGVGRGKAGINDVYWQQDVSLESGQTVEVKLHDVETACVNPD
jgi:hypothetical protein